MTRGNRGSLKRDRIKPWTRAEHQQLIDLVVVQRRRSGSKEVELTDKLYKKFPGRGGKDLRTEIEKARPEVDRRLGIGAANATAEIAAAAQSAARTHQRCTRSTTKLPDSAPGPLDLEDLVPEDVAAKDNAADVVEAVGGSCTRKKPRRRTKTGSKDLKVPSSSTGSGKAETNKSNPKISFSNVNEVREFDNNDDDDNDEEVEDSEPGGDDLLVCACPACRAQTVDEILQTVLKNVLGEDCSEEEKAQVLKDIMEMARPFENILNDVNGIVDKGAAETPDEMDVDEEEALEDLAPSESYTF